MVSWPDWMGGGENGAIGWGSFTDRFSTEYENVVARERTRAMAYHRIYKGPDVLARRKGWGVFQQTKQENSGEGNHAWQPKLSYQKCLAHQATRQSVQSRNICVSRGTTPSTLFRGHGRREADDG